MKYLAGTIVALSVLVIGLVLLASIEGETYEVISYENLNEVTELDRWQEGDGIVSSLSFSPSGLFLASGGEDKAIRLWVTDTGHNFHTINSSGGWIRSLVVTQDENLVVSGDDYGNVHSWLFTYSMVTEPGLHLQEGAGVTAIAPVTLMNKLAISRSDGSVTIWNRIGGTTEQVFDTGSPIRALAAGHNGTLLATGNGDYSVWIWDLELKRRVDLLAGHDAAVTALDFGQGDMMLASGDENGLIYLWNLTTGDIIHTLTGHTAGITALRFNPDVNMLVSASLDGAIRIWDPGSGTLLQTLTTPDGAPVYALTFNFDGTRLASGYSNGVIRIWGIPAPVDSDIG